MAQRGVVDITSKEPVLRVAVAEGSIKLRRETIMRIIEKKVEKGDPLEIARTAAILAVKKTWELIPHCHPIPLTGITVEFTIEKERIKTIVTVKAIYKTGVEMEALTGVTIALLTLWDVVKKYEKDVNGQYPYTSIEYIRVIKKEKISLPKE